MDTKTLNEKPTVTLIATASTSDALIPSLLAILETGLAMTIGIFVAVKWGTWHIAIAACIAPFLLLRTKASTKLAVKWLSEFWEWSDPFFQRTANSLPGMVIGLVLSPVSTALAAVLCRFFSVLWTVLTSPINSLAQIPNNWAQNAWCMDVFVPLEILPGSRLLNLSERQRASLSYL